MIRILHPIGASRLLRPQLLARFGARSLWIDSARRFELSRRQLQIDKRSINRPVPPAKNPTPPSPSFSEHVPPSTNPVSSPAPPVPTTPSNSTWTVPNILTMTRIAATPFVGYHLINHNSTAAMAIFIYSCVTDFVDGYIARKWHLQLVVGSILDPMADKFLMTVCTLSLSWLHVIPPWLAVLIVGRDVLLSFMAFWIRYQLLPAPKTFRRFADVRIPSVSVHPSLLGKVNTALQMVYVGGLVLRPGIEAFSGDLALVFSVFEIVVACTTLGSGLDYVFSKRAFKYVK